MWSELSQGQIAQWCRVKSRQHRIDSSSRMDQNQSCVLESVGILWQRTDECLFRTGRTVINSSKQLSGIVIGEACCGVDAWPCCSLPRFLRDCIERESAFAVYTILFLDSRKDQVDCSHRCVRTTSEAHSLPENLAATSGLRRIWT